VLSFSQHNPSPLIITGYSVEVTLGINDAVGELIFHNRYSYAGGNPVNRVDPSGLCWLNTNSSANQHQQCLEAWVNYATSVNLDDPTIRDLLRQENDYWGNLPYNEFADLWNDNQRRPPLSTDPGGETLAAGAALVLPIALFDSPAPGPADAIALLGLLCVVGIAAIAGTGAIALPQRPQVNFARPSGPRITWQSNYQAARDATGACVACMAAQVLNAKFCNVNTTSGEGCPSSHIHVYRWWQDNNCFCRVVPDTPRVRCLANPYAGPSGGPHFPLFTPIPSANPELAICTGGWNQTT